MQCYDIAIVGAGMIGQAFALSIANKSSLKIAIIDDNDLDLKLNKKFHMRISAITHRSEIFLKDIGAWDLIERKYAFVGTNVWEQNSHGRLNFNSIDEGLTHLGHIIENDYLQKALFVALKKTNVTFIKAKLVDFMKQADGYQLNLDNSKILTTLLVGADGVNSRVRDLAYIKCRDDSYKQQAIICYISAEKYFEVKTWQRFLTDSIIALLPVDANKASIVWSVNNKLADELLNLPKKKLATRIATSVEFMFGKVEVISDVKSFNIIGLSAKKYIKQNLVLIGDAAHSIHPLAGQGANLGFADACELSKQIINYEQDLNNYQFLQQYARIRRFDNEVMAKVMSSLNWIYKEHNEPLRWLRGFGMNIINQSPVIKSALQKQVSDRFY